MAANLSDIEAEERSVSLNDTENLSVEKKEPAETEEPTVEDFLEAFENSPFFKKGHFTCAISQALMLDPVVLNGSGQTVDRSSAIQLIASAVQDGKEPICPITQKELLITVSRGELPKLSQPESYFVDNAALKSLISASIQDFRNSEGDKYQKVPDPMIKPRDVIQPESENAEPVVENDALQNEPLNRNTFFTQKCQDICVVFSGPAAVVTSLCCTSAVRTMVFPPNISCAQALMLWSGSTVCCFTIVCACVGLLKLGGAAEAYCREDDVQVDAVTDVSTAQPLIMQEGDEANEIEMQTMTSSSEGSNSEPVPMRMIEEDGVHNSASSLLRLYPGRM